MRPNHRHQPHQIVHPRKRRHQLPSQRQRYVHPPRRDITPKEQAAHLPHPRALDVGVARIVDVEIVPQDEAVRGGHAQHLAVDRGAHLGPGYRREHREPEDQTEMALRPGDGLVVVQSEVARGRQMRAGAQDAIRQRVRAVGASGVDAPVVQSAQLSWAPNRCRLSNRLAGRAHGKTGLPLGFVTSLQSSRVPRQPMPECTPRCNISHISSFAGCRARTSYRLCRLDDRYAIGIVPCLGAYSSALGDQHAFWATGEH